MSMISIIIPTFNEEKELAYTVENLQRYCEENGGEIIVSDDNSTDNTIAIAQKYAHHVVAYKSGKQPVGAGATRNRGARQAKGQYLVFLDASVHIPNPNEFFRKALSLFENDPHLCGLTVSLRVRPKDATMADKFFSRMMDYLYVLYNNILKTGGAPGKFQLVRADAFKKIGGFREDLVVGEDYDLFRRLANIGHTYMCLGLIVFHSGRRAHQIGWPKLLWLWTKNGISVTLFGRSASKQWDAIR